MYIGQQKYILSNAILRIAGIDFVLSILMMVCRMVIRKADLLAPDMMDALIGRLRITFSIVQILLISLVFYCAWQSLLKSMKCISEDDHIKTECLREEIVERKLFALSTDTVNKLFQIWIVILLGAQIVHDFTSFIYRRFVSELFAALSGKDSFSDATFVSIYNSTHGFKYLAMLSAILLGVMVTGIFLNDRLLKAVAVVITVLFLISFSILQMTTVAFAGKSIGIVWTSVIFHLTKTVGLILFSLYLRHRYKNL